MRNFEPWRDDGATAETAEERLERLANEAAEDPMEELEKKTVDQKREMDILDKLQEVRQRNARLERADVDRALTSVSSRVAVGDIEDEVDEEEARRRAEEEEDEAEVRRRFGRLPPSIELAEPLAAGEEDGGSEEGGNTPPVASTSSAGPTVKRKLEEVEPDALSVLSAQARAMTKVDFASSVKPATTGLAGVTPAKKKKVGGALLPGIKRK